MLPFLALLSAALAAPAPKDQVDVLVSAQVRSLMATISDLRKLQFSLEIPVTVESPEDIRAESLEDLEEPEVKESLEAMRATLRAFQLAPPGADVAAAYADIMKESLGGYYSSDERRLVLVEHEGAMSTSGLQPGSEEAMTAAHELVHALQDQNFDLWTMLNRDLEDDDVDLALGSLVEGDASLAMLEYTQPGTWRALSPADRENLIGMMSGETVLEADSALGRAPRILRESLLFPYGHGLAFVAGLHADGGWRRIDQAFAQPPLSSEQILHPERYATATPDWPIRLELPDLAPLFGDGWATVEQNTFGEAGILSVLRDHLPHGSSREQRAAAAGWGGDRYVVLRGPTDDTWSGVWLTTWDSPADAREFLAVARDEVTTLAGTPLAHRAGAWQASTAQGAWSVSQSGADVLVLLGTPATAAPGVRRALDHVPRHRLTTLQDVAPPKGEPRKADEPAAP